MTMRISEFYTSQLHCLFHCLAYLTLCIVGPQQFLYITKLILVQNAQLLITNCFSAQLVFSIIGSQQSQFLAEMLFIVQSCFLSQMLFRVVSFHRNFLPELLLSSFSSYQRWFSVSQLAIIIQMFLRVGCQLLSSVGSQPIVGSKHNCPQKRLQYRVASYQNRPSLRCFSATLLCFSEECLLLSIRNCSHQSCIVHSYYLVEMLISAAFYDSFALSTLTHYELLLG